MKVMPILIRREFWEHRMMLVMAPLALCALYLILCVLAGAKVSVHLETFGREPMSSAEYLVMMHVAFTALLYFLMAVVGFFYLCDCLYAERKDRSILFWKSLPVSDTLTVLSKLFVALIAIPVVVYILSLVTNILAFGILKVMIHGGETPPAVASNWTFGGWLRVNGYLIVDILVLALWFAPVAAYQLLISAAVPRAPFVFTLLPPLALVFGEALFLGTWNIGHFLIFRLGAAQLRPRHGEGLEGVIDALNALPMLERPDLWIGVGIAAALIVLTIRVRRHRDES